MKKIFTTVFFAAIAAFSIAQGPPPPSVCTPSLSGPSGQIVPDTIANLPHANSLSTYTTDIQFFVPSDTVVPNPFSPGTTIGVQITDFTLNEVIGLPSDFSYVTNPTTGVFPGNTAACMTLSSAGVTSAVGTYPLRIKITAHVQVPLVGAQSQVDTIYGYKLVVDQPVGIVRVEKTDLDIEVFPNPFSTNTTVVFSLKASSAALLTISDVTGKTVRTANLDGKAGVNDYTFAKENLQNGIYFITLTSGEKTITKKVSIQ